MTRGKVRVIGHRRRRELRTDYRQRLGLLRSGKPRLVVRRSTNSMTCQLVKHDPKGDKSIVSCSGRDLSGFGWKAPTGNLPAAYLTGYLCGTMGKKKGVKHAVLDMGLQKSTSGSRIYSTLKGAVDAGIEVPHSGEVLPADERLRGMHVKEHTKRDVPAMFDSVKKAIGTGKPDKSPPKKGEKKAGSPAGRGKANSSKGKPSKTPVKSKKPAAKKAK